MQKPLSDGFSGEIFAVFLGEKGEQREQDFDSLPEAEKKRLRIQTNRRALRAAGYVPSEGSVSKNNDKKYKM